MYIELFLLQKGWPGSIYLWPLRPGVRWVGCRHCNTHYTKQSEQVVIRVIRDNPSKFLYALFQFFACRHRSDFTFISKTEMRDEDGASEHFNDPLDFSPHPSCIIKQTLIFVRAGFMR